MGLRRAYLTLTTQDAPQREHDLREVFNGMRYVVRGLAWRMIPNDLPPWSVVYQQAERWIAAGVFEAMTQDLRRILRVLEGRGEEPSRSSSTAARCSRRPRAAALDTTGPSGKRLESAHGRDTLGHLLSLHVTAANEQDREQVGQLARDVQKQTGQSVELAYVDQGYSGEKPAAAAEKRKIELSVVKLPEAKRGFVLLPRRWLVERSFAWLARFRRLAKDYERMASTLRGMHLAAFAILLLARLAKWTESA